MKSSSLLLFCILPCVVAFRGPGPVYMDRGLYHKKFGEMLYLDYCCGIGDSTRDMIQKIPRDSDIRVVGIDMNPVNVAIARRRHSPLVSFYHGSLPEMRIPKESVDLIQIKCSLIGLMNKERHLQEVYRILKPSGLFLVIQEHEHDHEHDEVAASFFMSTMTTTTTRGNDNLLLDAIFDDCCERWVQDDLEYRLYMKE